MMPLRWIARTARFVALATSDSYPVAIRRDTVHAGTIFYDPKEHVLVVTAVRPDGAVYFIDGHPDGSLTWKRSGEAFVVGTARLGGGFENSRPRRRVLGLSPTTR